MHAFKDEAPIKSIRQSLGPSLRFYFCTPFHSDGRAVNAVLTHLLLLTNAMICHALRTMLTPLRDLPSTPFELISCCLLPVHRETSRPLLVERNENSGIPKMLKAFNSWIDDRLRTMPPKAVLSINVTV